MKALTKAEELDGTKPVKALDSRPEIPISQQAVWEAFAVLSSGRGMGVGFVAVPFPLGFLEIDAYARRYGPYEEAEFERFHRLLRGMDAVFMQHALSKKGE